MSLADNRERALAAARAVAHAGMPFFACRLKPNGDPLPPEDWEKTEGAEAIDRWIPGRALCGVTGVAYDVLDVDPRNGGKESLARLLDDLPEGLETYARVSTPSGGWHFYIAPLGIGSRGGFLPGLDLKGGREDGTSRGFVFMPPTERMSKGPNPGLKTYLWVEGPEFPDEDGDGRLAELIEQYVSERRSANGSGGQGTGDTLRAMLNAEPGSRNNALWAGVTRLAGVGIAHETIAAMVAPALREANWQPRHGTLERDIMDILSRDRATVTEADMAALESVNEFDPRKPAAVARVPEYPVADGVLGELVESAEHLPPAIVGGAGLAALAAAASSWALEMPDTSSQYTALWIPLLAPRGAGKSPALDLAFEVLRELDAASFKTYRREIGAWSRLAKEERDGTEKPSDRSLIVDDFTLEHLARVLASGEERACVVSDELSGWLLGLGRYAKGGGGAEKGRLLSLWSCGQWKYGRVTGETNLLIERPVVPVVGGLQPHLHVLLGDDETGFRPRWLPHYVASWEADWGSTRAPGIWDERIAALYEKGGVRLRLRGKGLDAWLAWRNKWRADSRAPDVSDTVHGALAKADVQCARIALALAAGAGESGSISEESIQSAAAIVEYVLGVWNALPSPEQWALSERERILREKVSRLVNWLEKRPSGQATRSEIRLAKVGGVASGADVTDLLKEFSKMYPRCISKEKAQGKAGPTPEIIRAPSRIG